MPQRYPSSTGSPTAQYGVPIPQNAPPPNFQPGISGSPGQNRSGPSAMHGGIPYPFGQLPANLDPKDPKSQHPIPGSYNRNTTLNPKIQSFVPGGSMSQLPAPQAPFPAPGSHHSSPQISSPHMSFQGGFPPSMPPPHFGGPTSYGMNRQGSSGSGFGPYPGHGPHYGPPPIISHQPPPQPPPQHHHHLPPNPGPAHLPNKPPNSNVHIGPPQGNQTHSQLSSYGNPAGLPPKPATGI